MTAIRPYADHYDDGLIHLSFTLPVPFTRAARKAATMLAEAMGLESPEVAHCEELTEGFTYFVLYGRCPHTLDYAAISDQEYEPIALSEPEIEEFAAEHLTRKVVVVGASVGTDTHTVGIDAILNLKGYEGKHGLEAYGAFETHNLGGQVSNESLVAKVMDLKADALLVSQTVTQQELHVGTLRDLVERVEASGRRSEMILICGGPRITIDLARELGFDTGFSKGTYPHHVASYIVREMASRSQVPSAETTSAVL